MHSTGPADPDHILKALGDMGVNVTGLRIDSRRVQPGEVFLAWPGGRSDGRRHIAEAARRGAAAVLWEREGHEWDSAIALPNLPVTGLRRLAGPLAHRVFGRPSEQLRLTGVTGTNGKTSVTQWIAQARVLAAEGAERCAVIGTLGIGWPGELESSDNTTPDAVETHRALARFVREGAASAAMEVSSIGLDQERAEGLVFSSAVFTNLTRDHLDYHGDMESYAAAKRRLFEMPGLKRAVLNLDDVQGVALASALAGRLERIGYSTWSGAAERAGCERWLEAHDIALSAGGIAFTLRSSWGETRIACPMLGRHNVANLLAVLGVLLGEGMQVEAAAVALARLSTVPGRLERFGGKSGSDPGAQPMPLVVVDYAHTPDALENALATLAELARGAGGRLTVVFGCGGERDRGKRPLMGAVAARHAQRILITSDNPRSEDPAVIAAEIASGIPAGAEFETVPDRAEAIGRAVGAAGARDVVLLAGKGHENTQEAGGVRTPFSDAQAALAALSRWTR